MLTKRARTIHLCLVWFLGAVLLGGVSGGLWFVLLRWVHSEWLH